MRFRNWLLIAAAAFLGGTGAAHVYEAVRDTDKDNKPAVGAPIDDKEHKLREELKVVEPFMTGKERSEYLKILENGNKEFRECALEGIKLEVAHRRFTEFTRNYKEQKKPVDVMPAPPIEYENLYCVLHNGSKEMGVMSVEHRKFKYLTDIIGVFDSLTRIGMKRENCTILYDSRRWEELESMFNEEQKREIAEIRKKAEEIGAIQGTEDKLEETLKKLAEKATKDDLSVIYVTGHDSKTDNGEIGFTAGDGVITPKEFLEYINKIKGKKYIVLDYCYGADAGKLFEGREDVLVVCAASPGEKSTSTVLHSFGRTFFEYAEQMPSGRAFELAKREHQEIIEKGAGFGAVGHVETPCMYGSHALREQRLKK